MFKLILKFQDTVVKEYTFSTTPVTIGRREDNDVAIENMAVSGHHAVIEEEEPGHYVLVDLESLNGSYLNGMRIKREHILHGDSLIIGKHVLSFVDLGFPSEEELSEAQEIPALPKEVVHEEPSAASLEKTEPHEVLDAAWAELQLDEGGLPGRPKKVELFGTLTIITGGTPQILDLTKRVTTLGKAEDSDIKCAGLLVGKTAALINKRPNGYFLAYRQGMKKPEVNGETVNTQIQLQDGDEVLIGNTRMTFNLHEEIS
jgi:pSer/pThr/pTyr-binding forkhead associated (FHA) protein